MGLTTGSKIEIREDGQRLILEPESASRARFIEVPGCAHPILSLGKPCIVTSADLIDPFEDDV